MGELPRGHGFDPGKAQEASRSIPKATCLKVRLATRQQGFRLLPQAKHEVTGRLSPRQRRRLARPGLYAMDIVRPSRKVGHGAPGARTGLPPVASWTDGSNLSSSGETLPRGPFWTASMTAAPL